MTCPHKHTKYQPTDAEWRCPKCGATDKQGFVINEGPSDGDCALLHGDDGLRCFGCGYEMTGMAFATYLVRKNSLVPCPACNGKGLVKKESAVADLTVVVNRDAFYRLHELLLAAFKSDHPEGSFSDSPTPVDTTRPAFTEAIRRVWAMAEGKEA